jgi:hypothetical protein
MPKQTFPKELLVTEERPANDQAYLMISKDVTDLNYNDFGQEVAVYHLVEVKRLEVDARLVAKKSRR